MIRPLKLLDFIDGQLIGENVEVSGISLHSDGVQFGDLFVALGSERYDSEAFIEKAIEKGARAIAIESLPKRDYAVSVVVVNGLRSTLPEMARQFYQNPSHGMYLVGVTGTNGKSSVVDYIRQLFILLGVNAASIGTLGFIGQSRMMTSNTTPDVFSLQKMLSHCRDESVKAISMEVSSHALSQARTKGIAFNAAIFTNLTQDHLDYHKTMKSYAKSKALLFSYPEISCVIVNQDDDYAEVMLGEVGSRTKIVKFSLSDKSADVYFNDITLSKAGYELEMIYKETAYHFSSNLIGRFNLTNLMAAMIALVEYGFNLSEIVAAAERVEPVIGRMQLVKLPKERTVIVDYAHTPDALDNILAELKPICKGHLHVIFGCGGDRDKTKRPLMAEVAYQWADHLWVTSDNPRSENPGRIIEDVISTIPKDKLTVLENRKEAIREAVKVITAEDILVVAGKGHECYQQVGDQKIPFDDVIEVQQACSINEAGL